MVKPRSQNNVMKASKKAPKIQHAFRNIREPILSNYGLSTVMSLTPVSGSVTVFGSLNPVGLQSVYYNSSNSTYQQQGMEDPHLRWLASQAINFGSYRVTRAKLVFIGNAGSTSTGTLNLFGSKDPLDAGTGINTAYMQGNGCRSFDLAASSVKELSLNLPVDPTWKKVSKFLTVAGNNAPFTGPVTGFVNVNSVGDLCFSSFAAQIVSGPNQNCGSLFLDYDVEFKDPMALSMNA